MQAVAASEERKRQRLEEERRHQSAEATAVMAKNKTKRDLTPDRERQEDIDDMLPALQPMPLGIRKISHLSGVEAYHWIGNAWEISGETRC